MATSVHIVDNIEATSDVVVMTNTKITHGKIQQVQCIQKFKCGACKKLLELTEEDTKRVKCPYCNNWYVLPSTTLSIISSHKFNLIRPVSSEITTSWTYFVDPYKDTGCFSSQKDKAFAVTLY
jgi:LSD1 subclass zinc finger protein